MEFFSRIPTWVWIAGAAVIAFLFLRHKSGGGTPSNRTTGGGGSVRTGNTRIEKGAIDINVSQDGEDKDRRHHGDDDDKRHHHQPGPKPPDATKNIIVPKDETLGQLAKYLHWSDKTLAQVEELNAKGGDELTPSSRLKKGQTIVRPVEKNND